MFTYEMASELQGFHRPTEMKEFAEETFNLLKETVVSNIGDVRREAFRLATGNMKESPFSSKALAELRHKWAKLLESPSQALIVDEGQPFLLRGLAQWLKKFGDLTMASWLMERIPLLLVFGLGWTNHSPDVLRFSLRR